jgi:hypothetical protein
LISSPNPYLQPLSTFVSEPNTWKSKGHVHIGKRWVTSDERWGVHIDQHSLVNTVHRMASAATVRRLWLLDNPQLRRELFNKRRVGVHDINRSRAVFGEFHHLFKELWQDSVRFLSFCVCPSQHSITFYQE